MKVIWIGLVALVVTSVGCVSVPTERNFTHMEALATEHLPGVSSLDKDASCVMTIGKLQTNGLSANLTVDAVVRIALANNPRIQAEYARLEVAAAERLSMQLLKNPELSAGLLISEKDSSDEVLELGAEIDLLHIILQPKRSRIGAAQYATVEMDVARSVQQLAYDTRIAYYRLLAAQERLAKGESVLQAADAARQMAGRLREAGNIKELDKLNREALYEQAALAVSAAELAVAEAREALNVLMGLPEERRGWQVDGTLPEPTDEQFSQHTVLTNALESSMMLSVTRSRIRAASEALGMARVESVVPALHVGVDAEREPEGTWLAGPMIAVELPLFNFGQARRPAAKAALQRLQQEYAAQAVEISSAVRTTLKRISVSSERVKRYREQILPLQRKITNRTQLQYNAMQLGVFQLLQAKQMEIATDSAYIDELLNYWIARIELEQIRGGLLAQPRDRISVSAAASMESGGNGGH